MAYGNIKNSEALEMGAIDLLKADIDIMGFQHGKDNNYQPQKVPFAFLELYKGAFNLGRSAKKGAQVKLPKPVPVLDVDISDIRGVCGL